MCYAAVFLSTADTSVIPMTTNTDTSDTLSRILDINRRHSARAFYTIKQILSRASAKMFDSKAPNPFHMRVQMMPNIIVASAKRCQGRLSCWHAKRAVGIVKENF
jgi:hypothetical protein